MLAGELFIFSTILCRLMVVATEEAVGIGHLVVGTTIVQILITIRLKMNTIPTKNVILRNFNHTWQPEAQTFIQTFAIELDEHWL